MSSDLEVKWGTVSLAGHGCDRIGFRHRPGKANEGDELGLACIAARSTHDFFDPTRAKSNSDQATLRPFSVIVLKNVAF
jgi:hypothetical protein